MLIADLYSLLPAFTLAAFLTILLWPENIAYKIRLRLFAVILLIWVVASFIGMSGYGTNEPRLVCFINTIVGCLGLFIRWRRVGIEDMKTDVSLYHLGHQRIHRTPAR